MIAVVYSGSRYATWKLAEKEELISEFKTPGINPFFNDERAISILLNKSNDLVTYAERIRKIWFFGAGAFSPERKRLIANALEAFFRYAKVSVEHDLKAAAIATCGDSAGLVGILGSGTNAAYYSGKKLKVNNNGLGYILNDEGSANWLGRKLLKAVLNNTLPENLRKQFDKKFGLERRQILDKIYKQSQPILFLTSFSEFFLENKKEEFVERTVKEGFRVCLENYMLPLVEDYPDTPVHFAGTVAFGFEDWLREESLSFGVAINSVVKAPIYNVLKYYTNKN